MNNQRQIHMHPASNNKQLSRLRKLAFVMTSASLAFASHVLMAQPESPRDFPDQAYVVPVAGQSVPVREGLQSILPEGWYFYIKPSTQLPSSMTWRAGDKWTAILDSLAQDNALSVNINWADKGVILSPAEKAESSKNGASTSTIIEAQPVLSPVIPSVSKQLTAQTHPSETELASRLAQGEKSEQALQLTTPQPAATAPQFSTQTSTEKVALANPQGAPATPTVKVAAPAQMPNVVVRDERPVFNVKPGQNLRAALSAWLHAQGYSMEWTASQNPVFGVAHRYEGESVTEMLGELLVPMGMRAEVYYIGNSEKKIVIKQLSNNSH